MNDFKQSHEEWLTDPAKPPIRQGTYWGIKTKINAYELADAMTRDSALTGDLQNIRTRLNQFSAEEQGRLINWGYALTDAAMRKWVISGGATSPASWPDPKYPL
ncbi:MAG: hypothetical protein ACKVQU_00475 [Burkholderiales bacterium]